MRLRRMIGIILILVSNEFLHVKASGIFFAAALDRLSDGSVYEYQCNSSEEYHKMLTDMNSKSTVQGRMDGGLIRYK